MEITQLLHDDHQQAIQRLNQLRRARESAEQHQLFRELKDELEIHAQIEEELFYPALHGSGGKDLCVDECIAEHKKVRLLLSQLEQMIPGSDSWARSLDALNNEVEHHIKKEERELFPRMRTLLTQEAQGALLERMAARKADLSRQGERMEAQHNRRNGAAEQAAAQTSEQAYEYARKMGEQGEAAVAQGAGVAAEQARRAADALYETSDNLEKQDQERLSQYLRTAANGLNRFSSRLTDGDIDGLLQEARANAERHPALLLGGAIAAGFLLTRFLKATAQPSTRPAQDGSENVVLPGTPAPPATSKPAVIQPLSAHSQETR
ncbi:hemerythrin domain-containing protein [Nitrococcus mobilis]|uniref:Hemerythrin-like domain-containing protein n=1 Tax=Nitrococcus mobilis Nb-231 TaxID=314278 RepID=A4BTE1_9GAMM|nr:hemerythrin domain-containing protein [Nitrococcus mobilis]EAR21043.1 hypothetical protein NB231_07732 [Nitrococcus mobilis Nb-231]